MKTWHQFFLLSAAIALSACNATHKSSENTAEETAHTRKEITFADFKKIAGVDNVQEVPYLLLTKRDSIHFYTAPKLDADFMKIAYDPMDKFYGFEEFDDFYAIHYSIKNNISNSIEAFVLKSEFTAAFDLTLAGVDLYQIRSSNYKGAQDFEDKSFKKYGTIQEVSQEEFVKASKTSVNEPLSKKSTIKLINGHWVYQNQGKEKIIVQHKNADAEEGLIVNEYIGQSPFLNLEVFQENSEGGSDTFYAFHDVYTASETEIYAAGYPHIVPANGWITFICSNNDVGSDFVIGKYLRESASQENILYINFTNFKIANEVNAFWADQQTFYVEVFPLISAPAPGKKQKSAFLKIVLKPDLF